MRDSRVRRSFLGATIALVTLLSFDGGGYTVRPPFNSNIRTVYVPVFRSITFRRDVNFQLTEEVIKQIERRTPFKVVGKPEGADTTLEGVINFADKNLILENPFNLPRQLTANMTAAVTWTDNRTQKKVGEPMTVTATVNFFPEVGETSAAAFLKANQRLATDIVNAMEQKW